MNLFHKIGLILAVVFIALASVWFTFQSIQNQFSNNSGQTKNQLANEPQNTLTSEPSQFSGKILGLTQNTTQTDITERLKSLGSQTQTTQNLNQTDTLAHNLLIDYFSLKEGSGGGTLDATIQQSLADSVLKQTENRVIPYTLSKLIIIPANDDNSVKNYANNVGSVFLNQPIELKDNELNIFSVAIANEDKQQILKLDDYSATYGIMIHQFLGISVPQDISSTHLKLVNSIALLKQDVEKMRQYFNDPMAGIVGFTNYQTDFKSLQDAISEIKSDLAVRKISFTQKDGGYVFVAGI